MTTPSGSQVEKPTHAGTVERQRALRSTVVCPHSNTDPPGPIPLRCGSATARNRIQRRMMDAGIQPPSASRDSSVRDGDPRGIFRRVNCRRERRAGDPHRDEGDRHGDACAWPREPRRDPRRGRALGGRRTCRAKAAIWKYSASTGGNVGAKWRGLKQKTRACRRSGGTSPDQADRQRVAVEFAIARIDRAENEQNQPWEGHQRQ